ncbi:MAG TPA: 30S ribosomal protein S18 [Polyangiaceae bacterium]
MMREGPRDRMDMDAPGPRRSRRRGCTFCSDDAPPIDYKDPQSLKYFVSERGKIVPRRISGACAKHQRAIQLAVKRSRNIALLPFTTND